MKIPNKSKLQQIALSRSSQIYFEDFVNVYKKCSGKLHSLSFFLLQNRIPPLPETIF